MFNLAFSIPKLPLAHWVNVAVDWLTQFTGFFNVITNLVNYINDAFQWVLNIIPIWLFIIIILVGTWFLLRKKTRSKGWGLLFFELIGLLYIWNEGYWNDTIKTLTLVLTSTLLSVIIGIPLGIWMSKSRRVQTIVNPILDFMQTLPSFVYLIPAVAFFGIGTVPGVLASFIFSLPPTVRFTNLGIRQVPQDLKEAADSYGTTGWQKLVKVEIPLAKDNIMGGVNQTLLLALSMVVIAAMIGSLGLGTTVYYAVQQNDSGSGFAAGLAIVILAIIMDRIVELFSRGKQDIK